MKRINLLCLRALVAGVGILFSCEKDAIEPIADPAALFLSFSSNEQTLPTAIHDVEKTVTLEVANDADLTKLVPVFEVIDGYSVLVNGTKQISGKSVVDFTSPVKYSIKNASGRSTDWQVNVVPLRCKILIDASHDGGLWWFPQSIETGFNAQAPHQGKDFSDMLKAKGFDVTELGRDHELTEELFYGSYIVIRVGGVSPYTENELAVYGNLLQRGMNLVFLTDHDAYDLTDGLGEYLGLDFEGVASGTITAFAQNDITTGMTSLDYIAGSVLENLDDHPNDIEVLAWLNYDDLNGDGFREDNEPATDPVMGILHYPRSKVFFLGDSNGIEIQPQPFIDNLIHWMGLCFEP
ncbi:MAG TPA: hypothetical protein VFV79_07725 [Saprospiraceae bacterium]|nr:hypothetical protein [Saprospiraceae bacterium]